MDNNFQYQSNQQSIGKQVMNAIMIINDKVKSFFKLNRNLKERGLLKMTVDS